MECHNLRCDHRRPDHVLARKQGSRTMISQSSQPLLWTLQKKNRGWECILTPAAVLPRPTPAAPPAEVPASSGTPPAPARTTQTAPPPARVPAPAPAPEPKPQPVQSRGWDDWLIMVRDPCFRASTWSGRRWSHRRLWHSIRQAFINFKTCLIKVLGSTRLLIQS